MVTVLPEPVLLKTGAELSTVVLVSLGVFSLVVGFIGGMVGIALGVIRLPLMTFLGVSPLIAASTNLAVSFVSSVAGSWPAILQQRVVMRIALLIGIPAVAGSFLGGRFADQFPTWMLLILVSLFLVWSSVAMLIRARAEIAGRTVENIGANSGRGEINRKSFIRESGLGFVIGVVGGAVGLALGVLRLPALIQFLKMEPRLATGTNLIITVLSGAFGFVGHIAAGRIDYTLLLVVGIPGTVGMYLGSRISDRIPSVKLRIMVGVVLLIMAPFVFADAITRIGD